MKNEQSFTGNAPRAAVTTLTPWKPSWRLNLGSLSIDQYSQTALIDEILHHALFGRETRQVVTANAQFYVMAQKSQRFRECLRDAHYICADGMPIVWACSAFCDERVSRIAGVSLMEKLCQYGAAHRLRVFLLGGKPGTADKTAEMLKKRYPGIQIAGVNCPHLGFERHPETLQPVLDHIADTKPHILFVGLGAPKQEFLIRDHIRRIRVPLAIGIGGSFEILSGQLQRAPMWMRSCGLEWFFRLAQEPGRLWKRYLIGNAEFVWHILRWRLASMFSTQEDPWLEA